MWMSQLQKSKQKQLKIKSGKILCYGYSPQPIPTRWGSWLNSALYYPKVKAIVKSFVSPENFGNSSKVSLQNRGLAGQLLNIKDHFECLIQLIKKMESAKYTSNKAVQQIQELVTSTNTLKKRKQ